MAMALIACAPRGPQDPLAGLPGYRDRTVPIASAALFDPVRFAGTWHEVARFPVPFQSGCSGVTMQFGPGEGGLTVASTCITGQGQTSLTGTAALVGPGRLMVQFPDTPFVAENYWVLWVDESYRTAVIGTPDGRAGWILNRDPAIPQDRLAAAREILDFNGYDLGQLVLTGG